MLKRSTAARSKAVRAVVATSVALGFGAACIAPAAADTTSADTRAARSERVPIGKLKGEVGPGFTISINKSRVPAGKYKLIVSDKGTIHNFHIAGRGVDEATSVPETGKTVWKLRLRKGAYEIVCDPHVLEMHTTLKVV